MFSLQRTAARRAQSRRDCGTKPKVASLRAFHEQVCKWLQINAAKIRCSWSVSRSETEQETTLGPTPETLQPQRGLRQAHLVKLLRHASITSPPFLTQILSALPRRDLCPFAGTRRPTP